MGEYQIKATLHKWPGSFDSEAVRYEIAEKVEAENTVEAGKALDKIIESLLAILDEQGYRTRIISRKVKHVSRS